MSTLKSDAIVLKTTPFRNTSLIVRCFTREHGLLSLIAKGARREKSPLAGYLETANYIEIVYVTRESRSVQTLVSSSFIKPFYRIHKSFEGAIFAYSVAELIQRVLIEGDKNTDVFDLSVTTLKLLDRGTESFFSLFLWFLVNLLPHLGFSVSFDRCGVCGKTIQAGYYLPQKGVFACTSCTERIPPPIAVTETQMDLLVSLKDSGIPGQDLPSISDTGFLTLRNILVSYLGFHSDQHINLNSQKILDKLI